MIPGEPFTNEQAVRVWTYGIKSGKKVPGLD